MRKKVIFITLLLVFLMCMASCEFLPSFDFEFGHIHTFGEWFATENATCTNNGVKVRYCSCGEKQSETVPSLSHNVMISEAVAPTCTETGLTAGKHCSECGEVIVKQEYIEELGHIKSEVVIENNVKPTSTTNGSFDSVIYCSICSDELSRETFVLPTLSANSCNVMNTSPVSEGETIYLQVGLNNPSGVMVKKAIINDIAYTVSSTSNASTILIEISHSNQFVGGETRLNVEGVVCEIEGVEYTIEFSDICYDNIFINGILECLSIDFADSTLTAVDWCFPNDTVNILITLNNPTGYKIEQIVIDGVVITNLFKLSDNIYYTPVSISTGFNTKVLNSISYSNASIAKTISYSNKKTSIYKVASNETKYICNRDDLLTMTSGYYYVLTNDIDLSGREWVGNDFDGVFNGNGYSIKNMTIATTFKNKSVELGLFLSATGIITDLTIENTMCIVELISDDGKQYDVKFGNISAIAEDLIISNCNVKDSCVIDIKNKTYINGSVDYNGVGGIIGYLEDFCDGFYVKNTSCYASISLQYDGGTYYSGLGGILGSSRSGDSGVYMKNILFGGKLSKNGSFGCGGLVGRFGFDVVFVCENAIVYGEINGYDGIGDGWLGEPQFINCLFLSSGRVSDYTCSLINSYKLTDFKNNEEILNDKNFYVNTMKFDQTIWMLDDLDIKEGKHPEISH